MLPVVTQTLGLPRLNSKMKYLGGQSTNLYIVRELIFDTLFIFFAHHKIT